MSIGRITELAEKHLPGEFTINKTLFQDGDERHTATHSFGWEVGCRYDIKIWEHTENVWVEYYEHDTMRDRQVYSIGLNERVVCSQ